MSILQNNVEDNNLHGNHDDDYHGIKTLNTDSLLSLPESILHTIFSLVPLEERRTLHQISKSVSNIVSHPDFLLERQSNGTSDEILFVVGGTFPTRYSSCRRVLSTHGESDYHGHDDEVMMRLQRRREQQEEEEEGHITECRRMTMEHNSMLYGYVPSLHSWRAFGGNMSTKLSSPSSPLARYTDFQPLYIPSPYYTLLIFGGKDITASQKRVDTVFAYHFKTARWETNYPNMLYGRNAREFHVCYVQQQQQVWLFTCDTDICLCDRCCHVVRNAASSPATHNDERHHHHDESSEKSNDSEGKTAKKPLSSSSSSSATTHNEKEKNEKKIKRKGDINNTPSDSRIKEKRQGGSHGHMNSNNNFGEHDVFGIQHDDDTLTRYLNGRGVGGMVEVLDLQTRTWSRSFHRAPSCPPVDGGVAVLHDRFVFLPGTKSTSCGQGAVGGGGTDAMDETHDTSANVDTNITALTRGIHMEAYPSLSSTTSSSSSSDGEQEEGEEEDLCSILPLDESLIHESPIFTPLPPHHRPGLLFDTIYRTWHTLPPRLDGTHSPTTISYKDSVVLVMGGYHSTETPPFYFGDSIVDYEDHVDFVWSYETKDSDTRHGDKTPQPGWTQQEEDDDEEDDDAVAAIPWQRRDKNAVTDNGSGSENCAASLSSIPSAEATVPESIPVSVRGAMATMYQNRLTLLGGLSTFSQTFNSNERRFVWQYCEERGVWEKVAVSTTTNKEEGDCVVVQERTSPTAAQVATAAAAEGAVLIAKKKNLELPMQALLDGYAFSVHL